MSRIFRNPSSIKMPQRVRDVRNNDNHGHGSRERVGVTECPQCSNVRFKKAWHASLSTLRTKLKDSKIIVAQYERCPACKMAREHLFEGELVIENPPQDKKELILNLIHNFADRARESDPQDRIIEIERSRGTYRITTTEN